MPPRALPDASQRPPRCLPETSQKPLRNIPATYRAQMPSQMPPRCPSDAPQITQNWGMGAGSGFSTINRNQRAQNGATPGEAKPIWAQRSVILSTLISLNPFTSGYGPRSNIGYGPRSNIGYWPRFHDSCAIPRTCAIVG